MRFRPVVTAVTIAAALAALCAVTNTAEASRRMRPVPAPVDGRRQVIRAAGDLSRWGGPEGIATRARQVELTKAVRSGKPLAKGEGVSLQLFDDVQVVGTVVESFVNVNGTVSTTATVDGARWGRVFMAATGGELKVRISLPEERRIFAIEFNRAESVHYALELDQLADDELNGYNSALDAIPVGPGIVAEDLPAAPAPGADAKTTTVIDVMVVYSNDALTAGGSAAGVANQIAIGMAMANDAHSTTGSGMYLYLVHSEQVAYTGSGNTGTDLNRLAGTSDGYMDGVHATRNTYGADFVDLLVGGSGGGIAQLLQTTTGNSAVAFSVVNWTAFDSYTPGHEIGHNMGLSHAPDQNYQAGPTSWSDGGALFGLSAAGHHWHPTPSAAGYCSMLTYTGGTYFVDGLSHTRVGVFSDPAIFDHGLATGVASTAYNANVLRTLKSVYAAYRTRSIGSNVILVEEPNGGESWAGETTHNIVWDSNGVTGNVKIELLRGGSLHSTIAASTDNDRVYEWTIPAALSGSTLRIRITSINEPGITDQSNADFTITERIYAELLDTNPGYTITGGWEYGAPDPAQMPNGGPGSSYDGSSIYDTNLDGGTGSTSNLTTPAIGCGGFSGVTLNFVGWFSVYTGYNAKVQVSNNGSTYNDVYTLTGGPSSYATAWSDYALDISAYADDQASVYVRFRHENVGGGGNYAGMSVDNIILTGISTSSLTPIFSDNFESGGTSAWDGTHP